ncbi:MAG: hypothetical protein ABI792_03530 [bacterium]
MEKQKQRKIISDKLVSELTGKTIEYWFKVLDKKGAKKKAHFEIFNLISNAEGLKSLGQWNHNLLATSYEWNRGLKERGQRDEGFEISISKTFQVPASILYNYWSDEKKRSVWLSEKKFEIRKTTENKSLVITWNDNTTVRIEIYNKGEDKSQIVIQHMKIPDSKTAAKMKIFWREAMDKLKSEIETMERDTGFPHLKSVLISSKLL